MSIVTESYTTVQNDDGSYTTTEVSTYTPPTKKEQAIAWTAFIGVMASPFLVVGGAVAMEKWAERREARKAKKAQKQNEA